MKRLPPFTMSFLLFGGMSASVPFLVPYFQSQGMNGAQIGLLAALGPLITIVSIPFWTGLADKRSKHRVLFAFTLLVAAAALFALPLVSVFISVFIVLTIYSFFFGPATSFSDNAIMFTLDTERHLYGRIRLGGTLGFAVMSALAGLIVENFGLRFAFWSAALMLLIGVLVSSKLKYPPVWVPETPRKNAAILLKNRRWRLFLLSAFAGGIAFGAYANFIFPYLKQLGAPASVIGFTYALGTVSEIPILFFGARFLRRFSAFNLMLLASGITGVRLIVFGMANSFIPILWLQLLNGFTSPLMWMAAVHFADEAAPPGLSASAQGHLGTMAYGLGPAVAGFIGGLLLDRAGGHVVFYVFGSVILGIVVLVAFAQHFSKIQQGQSIY